MEHKKRYQVNEEAIVRRRNAETDRQQRWAGVSDYFQSWNTTVNTFTNWASPEFYNSSVDNRQKEIEAQKTKENLQKRRNCLSDLLGREEIMYNRKVKEMKRVNTETAENGENYSFMNLELKRRSDETARRENELRCYQQHAFPNRNYLKEYGYFASRVAQDAVENCLSNSYNKDCGTSQHAAVDNVRLATEKDVLETKKIQLQTQVNQLQSSLEKNANQFNNFKLCEEPCAMQISKAEELFKKIFKEYVLDELADVVRLSASTDFVNRWITQTKILQKQLKCQIEFLEEVITAADVAKDFKFKYEVDKIKRVFSIKLQRELVRERQSHLFGCPSNKEPLIWWRQECKMWTDGIQERQKTLADVYSKLIAMGEKWHKKAFEDELQHLKSQKQLLTDVETLQSELKLNNESIGRLAVT